jgi:hypothetical protein
MKYLLLLVFGVLLFAGCLGGQDCSGGPVCGADGKTYQNKCLASDAGVSVASTGACVAACSDSDAKDIFSGGGVISNGKTFTDVCKDKTAVKEYFCENDEAKYSEIPCPAEYMCDAGKCVEAPCTDSDQGAKPNEKGTTTSVEESGTDSCKDSNTVTEYYCEDATVKSKSMDCASGYECKDGACVEATCSDSDGGEDASKAGTVTKGDISQADKCSGDTKVTEYYCSGNDVNTKIINCASGYKCQNGACVELPKCVDSDNGKDKFEKGTVTTPSNTYVDDCYSSTQVLEYFCSGEDVDNEKISCGSGYECKLGKCTELECTKEVDNFQNEDIRYEIEDFGSSELLRMHVGDIVELDDDLILKLYSVSGNESIWRLYLDYEDYLDNDMECSETIDEGDTNNDMCGENTGDIEVDTVNDGDDYADVYLDTFYVTQYYNEEGSLADWTDKAACPDDEIVYAEYDSYFYPYVDTESSGLNLDGKTFRLFNRSAKFVNVDVGGDSIEFDFDGDNYELDDGDTFEYDNIDYQIRLYFNDDGLYRMLVKLD